MKKPKCNSCGAKIIKKPLWHGQENNIPFSWDKINWRNALLPDLFTLGFLFVVLFLAWSYSHDTEACFEIYENPCEFVNKNKETCAINKQVTHGLSLDENLIINPVHVPVPD